jgi:dienelactone hydrolase
MKKALLFSVGIGGSLAAAPIDVKFRSLGETTAGSLFLPSGKGPFPGVITGPGFAGVKEMLIPEYAEALASAGIATLSFDYIGFGASTGSVRQDIKPDDQIQTYRDALDFLERDPRIDRARLGAWGTSLGGAHTLALAATDARVKRAVANIPHIEIDDAAAAGRLDMVDAMAADAEAAMTAGKPRVMVGVSGPPGARAAMMADGAVEWTARVTKNAPNFRNEVTASSLLAMGEYNTEGYAKKIRIPLRAITARDDSITPAKYIHAALEGLPNVDFKDFPGPHFGLFGANMSATVDLTVEWFKGKW